VSEKKFRPQPTERRKFTTETLSTQSWEGSLIKTLDSALSVVRQAQRVLRPVEGRASAVSPYYGIDSMLRIRRSENSRKPGKASDSNALHRERFTAGELRMQRKEFLIKFSELCELRVSAVNILF
jgi:hypothetical protein